MVKKKEAKKPSAKEEKLVNNDIFDTNGKLILKQKDEEQQILNTPDKKKKPTKVKIISAEEAQKLKQAAWRKYYSEHKDKYKLWNKNWRSKNQKKKKSE